MNIYEIYTKHPVTLEGGWDLIFVRAPSVEALKQRKLFDCVVTVNDYPMSSDGSDIVNWDLLTDNS
jgi:hypothetical protein